MQCLRTKLNQLSNFIVETKPHNLICLCEHWLTKAETDYYGNIENINMIGFWSRDKHIHGGVAIYVSSLLVSKALDVDK